MPLKSRLLWVGVTAGGRVMWETIRENAFDAKCFVSMGVSECTPAKRWKVAQDDGYRVVRCRVVEEKGNAN